jgi:RND family efflux transporter MFP subunit
VAGLIYLAYRYFQPAKSFGIDSITHVAQRRTVVDTVVERGTLESQNNFSGRCELPGWENKIIFIVPEGKLVKAGEVVVKFDSAATDKLIAEKKIALNDAKSKLGQQKQESEVQKNKSESDIATADLELTLARLDLEKYRDGDFKAEARELERSITEGEAELEKVSEELGNVRALVKKGFRSPEQLREFELRAKFRQFQLDRDKQKYMVLTTYDYKRKITDFEAKSVEGVRKLERAKTTSQAEAQKHESLIASSTNAVELETTSLKELEETLAKCEIKAPQDGTVAYANKAWYGQEERIREGATIRREQDIFYLPDMAKMQVKVQVHESVINKVKAEQMVNVRVDAFPDVVFTGKVLSVAELATSSFSDAKNYDAVVLIEKIPEGVAAKPGMTAQVEILIGEYADIVALPVTAVTEHFKQSYAYVVNGLNVERRAVSVGRTTHSFVEIKSGLEAGEVVALDAYQRGLADFASAERDAENKLPPAATPTAAPAPTASEGAPPTQ